VADFTLERLMPTSRTRPFASSLDAGNASQAAARQRMRARNLDADAGASAGAFTRDVLRARSNVGHDSRRRYSSSACRRSAHEPFVRHLASHSRVFGAGELTDLCHMSMSWSAEAGRVWTCRNMSTKRLPGSLAKTIVERVSRVGAAKDRTRRQVAV